LSAIWQEDVTGWTLLQPVGFQDEATLHRLVEASPQLLPLSGTPRLTVLGKEVRLGAGYADLVGVESTGRPVVIEVKLAYSPEARRAVVAQVLSYAAHLYRLSPEQFENDIIRPHLTLRGFSSILDAVRETVQGGALDEGEFSATLRESLALGGLRLVLVLDSAPDELVRLVGFLQTVTQALVIDLVTVASYDVSGTRVLVPQRVEPERMYGDSGDPSSVTSKAARPGTGSATAGVAGFLSSIDSAPRENQPLLRRLADWATDLERQQLASLTTYFGKRGEVTLLPQLRPDNVGLVTIWNWMGIGNVTFWRSVFERRAPLSITPIEQLIEPVKVGRGNNAPVVSEELLELLTQAYREAAASLSASRVAESEAGTSDPVLRDVTSQGSDHSGDDPNLTMPTV